jgi:CRISPR-associated protein Cas1
MGGNGAERAQAEDSSDGARAKVLGRDRAAAPPGALPELVPARMINEVLFCERLFYLEWVAGEFADNVFTVDGRLAHRRADKPGGALPPPPDGAPAKPASRDDDDEVEPAPEPPPYKARSLWLSSEQLGITAKIDVVEGEASGRVVPVEYKRGAPPDVPEGAYLPERAQLCAQVLLLRDAGYACEGGDIYFAGARRRVPIVVDEALEAATLGAVARARELALADGLPPPLVDSPKCNGCSLAGICLPDETNLLRRVEERPEPAPSAAEADTDAVPEEAPELRRLVPARDDAVPLYVQAQGARVGLDGDCLSVVAKGAEPVTARLANTSQVCLVGNVQITTQATRALLERGIPVAYLSTGGWFYGRATGLDSKNVELRMAQHRAASDPAFCLELARGIVASKIRNGRTLLRRNHEAPDPVVLSELEQLAKKAEVADAQASLLGVEGSAARVYFGAFTGMLKGAAALGGVFDLEGRNRRPPKDPINALLSFTYALLAKDMALAAAAVGLEPLLGFYHQPRFGRPSLALDLMEELRPLVADSTVIGAINNGLFGAGDFVRAAGSVAIQPAARRRLLLAYERRMDQLVTHPVFGYRLSYRRVLEVQARLLGRLLLGEIDRYPAFRTR